jgi:hypothetical protein
LQFLFSVVPRRGLTQSLMNSRLPLCDAIATTARRVTATAVQTLASSRTSESNPRTACGSREIVLVTSSLALLAMTRRRADDLREATQIEHRRSNAACCRAPKNAISTSGRTRATKTPRILATVRRRSLGRKPRHTAYEADRGKVAGGADEPTGRSKPALTVGQSALRATTVRKNVTLSAP